MDFGYFTLSDNRYPGNPRTPEQHVQNIFAECMYAEKIGMHSAWVGEHHFNLLGVNACPNILLAQLAGATKRIRLAPAVVLLPVHHPLHVAEEWATLDLLSGGRVDFAVGRGYDVKEYEPFQQNFQDSAAIFAEGLEILWRAWTEPGRWSHKGKYWQFEDVEIRPRPAQKPLRPYVGCFSRPTMEMAARNDWNIIFAPFAASMVYGSLADGARIYRETCEKLGKKSYDVKTSYFVHICQTPKEELEAKAQLVRYFHDALLAAFPSNAQTVPPTMAYFLKIVELLRNMKPQDLTNRSILVGPPQKIIDDLKTVEAAGISEVIIYFNYGLKPHAQVLEQMDRFMAEVAPAFHGSHTRVRAELAAAQ